MQQTLTQHCKSTICAELLIHVRLFETLWTVALCPWDSPGKNIGVGGHALLQGNLPNPGTEPGSPALQADSFPAEPPGKPILAGEAGNT